MHIIEKINSMLDYGREYGIKCLLAVSLSNLFQYKKGRKLSWRLLQYKHKVMTDYLYKNYYSKVYEKRLQTTIESQFHQCIWSAWLQGENEAPDVIRLTLASIRKNAGTHRVIVLTNENIHDYIEVPAVILDKHRSGIIGNAHFADIVRMMILAKYGGLWLDATMLLHEPIDESAFSREFFSVGLNKIEPSRYVANNKWLVGVVGGSYNSPFLWAISQMLNEYWTEHNTCIDYFVFDYLIAVLYENNTSFACAVDTLPRMEFYTNSLRKIINTSVHDAQLNDLMCKGQMYYLSYRYDYLKQLEDGNETVYGYLYRSLLSDQDERKHNQ